MGDLSDYKKRSRKQKNSMKSMMKVLLLVLLTNSLSIYICTRPSPNFNSLSHYTASLLPFPSCSVLLQELNATQSQLAVTLSVLAQLHNQLSETQQQLDSSNKFLPTLLTELNRDHSVDESTEVDSNLEEDISEELKLAVEPRKLPFGFTENFGSDEIQPPIGAACYRFKTELIKYMTYDVGGMCPTDDVLAQKLMLKGCEPLPRRRCSPKTPIGYKDPLPLPESLWSIPPDNNIVWDTYSCKSFQCLNERRNSKGGHDCNDCFDLSFREHTRWLHDNGELDYSIDYVLGQKPPGTIRIGLDIGGGSGTFAARMVERNITIVTTSMNFDAPFNNFIASRGLIAMHITVSQRLPFFDNTLDLVHSMHVLSNWIPEEILELIFYDIYRILRPGGLFWLDHFFCFGSQLNSTYVPILEKIGFNKLRLNLGRKLDKGKEKDEWYVSGLLEKPMS